MWIESNDKVVDEQNGFRKRVEAQTMKSQLSPTSSKQDKNVNYQHLQHLWILKRRTIWLIEIFCGIDSVRSFISLNGLNTGWFDVNIGLRQGCNLSPILFDLFINVILL